MPDGVYLDAAVLETMAGVPFFGGVRGNALYAGGYGGCRYVLEALEVMRFVR